MNKTQEKLVQKRYCVGAESTWKDVVERISKLPLILPKQKETKDALNNFDFIPAGRIIRGFGNDEINSLFNCSVYDFINTGSGIDSRESIMNMLKVVFELESRGVGVGINFSALRPHNEAIKKVSGETGGVVSWLKVVNTLLEQISQGGARKGAFMSIVDVWHPDIIRFATAKKDITQLEKMNISVNITDDFIEAVKNDEDWELVFPDHHHPDYDKLWTSDIYEWKMKKLPIKVYQKIKARKLLSILAENAWETGEPGLIFVDRANHINYATGQNLRASNPCLRGDQKVLTSSGYQKISSLVDKKTTAWNGFEWSEVIPKVTGENQPMRNVVLSNGSEIICTDYHTFILKSGDRIEAKDLKVGDKIQKYYLPKWEDESEYEINDGITVVSIDDAGIEKLVYCFNEPKNHTMVVNGCLTGNCSEEILSNEFCCLGHINLVNHLTSFYDTEKGTEVIDFDYQKLKKTISVAQNYLTSVIFANKYYFKIFETNQKNYRKIGIGFLGYADALIMMNLAYGSESALSKTEELMKKMISFAIEASNKMAIENSQMRCFYVDEKKLLQRFDFLDESLKESVMKFGVANSRLLTVAPTGSTAQLAGTSYGIEPNFLLKYERNDILGKRIVRSDLYKRLKGKVDDDVWKDTSNTTIEEHMATQETVQKYNDGSISKTINLPHYATIKDVMKVFTRAIEGSVIGVTVYRDGSRAGVMTQVEDESNYCPECDHKLANDGSCKSCPNCGWSACEV